MPLPEEVHRRLAARAVTDPDVASLMALFTKTDEAASEPLLDRVIEDAGGRVVAAGALIDRSGGKIELAVRTEALLMQAIESYEAVACPLCRDGGEAVRPGSRFKL